MEKQATERFLFCSVNIKIYKFSELACGSHLHGEILVQFFFKFIYRAEGEVHKLAKKGRD